MPGRGTTSLLSKTCITDGTWHRIGLIWDGSHRKLYVDGILVAEDTQDTLANSNNGLYIGTGKGMESGTFWSGLIDDVRIYKRFTYLFSPAAKTIVKLEPADFCPHKRGNSAVFVIFKTGLPFAGRYDYKKHRNRYEY
jgi:hypothetical protein